MSTGFVMTSAYTEQSDPSVVPTTGWVGIPMISNSLNTTTNTTESEIVSNGRMKSAGMVTGGEIVGDIKSELMFGTFDVFAAHGEVVGVIVEREGAFVVEAEGFFKCAVRFFVLAEVAKIDAHLYENLLFHSLFSL